MLSFSRAVAITPSDSVNLAQSSKVIIVGVTGAVKVDMVGVGTGVVLQLVAGYPYPIQVKKVYSTGTTATGIVELY
jgi:hypothetical protein